MLFIPLTRDASQSYAVLPKNKKLAEDLIKDPEFIKYLKSNSGNYRLFFEKPTSANWTKTTILFSNGSSGPYCNER